ncbi:hypothetical protein FQR65_LT00804 [Abscondita terminalis]|nr:hypothetical protein FQR65_LT00804 [Abscondita terminalis]
MKNSVIYSFIVAIVQVALALENGEFCEEELKCIEKLHLDKSHIEKICRDESTKFLPETDVDFNSFQFCHWNARNLQDINGNLNYDEIAECIQEYPRSEYGANADDDEPIGLKIALEAIEMCRHIPKGESHGQTAVKVQNCIDKHIMELVEKD